MIKFTFSKFNKNKEIIEFLKKEEIKYQIWEDGSITCGFDIDYASKKGKTIEFNKANKILLKKCAKLFLKKEEILDEIKIISSNIKKEPLNTFENFTKGWVKLSSRAHFTKREIVLSMANKFYKRKNNA